MKRLPIVALFCGAVVAGYFGYQRFDMARYSRARAEARKVISIIESSGGKAFGWSSLSVRLDDQSDISDAGGRVRLGEKWAAQGVGIESLASLRLIGELEIDFPECSDDDLQAIAKLPYLESLVLLRGRITSRGLRSLREAPDLRTLTISGKACREVDFDDFRGLDLRCLSLNGVESVTLRHMKHFADQKRLIAFEMVNCQIAGPGEIDFRETPNLRAFSVGNTKFSDDDLHGISSLHSARFVNLSGTGVRGPVVRRLQEMPALRSLSINDVELSDDAFAMLFELTELDSLEIDGSPFENDRVRHLSKMKSLRNLSVRRTPVDIDSFRKETLPSSLTTVRQGMDNTLVLDPKWIERTGHGRSLTSLHSQLFVMSDSGFRPYSKTERELGSETGR